MPSFSQISKSRLGTCDDRLQQVFTEVIKHFDCAIIEGHRGMEAQNKAYNEGKSQVMWPNGKHNSIPSKAVDAMPYPINWKDINRLCYFAGFVVAIGLQKGIKIRWGGDWNQNTELSDNKFNDLVHFEIVEG